jgi:PAS domain S-box-containing protein
MGKAMSVRPLFGANLSKLERIFGLSPPGIGVVVDRVIQQVNDKVCSIVGYEAEELVRQSVRILYPSEVDYDQVETEMYRQIVGWGIGTLETRWRRKDDVLIDVLLSFAPVDPAALGRGITFTALNITERKRAEAELLAMKSRILQAQKLESLGLLAGGIAHDFNNLLAGIVANVELALLELPASAPGRDHVQDIEKTAERAIELVQLLLAYSGQGSFKVSSIDLAELVRDPFQQGRTDARG